MKTVEPLLVGNFQIVQDTALYRFTSDAVLLARFLQAKKGECVADFCAGCGIVGLHFLAENPCVKEVVFFELQPALSALCRESIARNGLQAQCFVEERRVQDAPKVYDGRFSLILANPPFGGKGFSAKDEGKAICREEGSLSLEELAKTAKRCLKQGGRLALVHRADRVAEVLFTLKCCGLEPKKLQFVAGREGRKPYAVLVSAVKGGKAGVDVLPTHYNN